MPAPCWRRCPGDSLVAGATSSEFEGISVTGAAPRQGDETVWWVAVQRG